MLTEVADRRGFFFFDPKLKFLLRSSIRIAVLVFNDDFALIWSSSVNYLCTRVFLLECNVIVGLISKASNLRLLLFFFTLIGDSFSVLLICCGMRCLARVSYYC